MNEITAKQGEIRLNNLLGITEWMY
jgi:hypothetical protein